MKRRSRARWGLAMAGLAVAAGAAWLIAHATPPPGNPGQPPYLTVFLIDGLSQARFERLRQAGRLPQMERLAREGTRVVDGVSAFPSMTGYGFYPFLTGRDAARSGILGLRWFDRLRGRGQIRNYVGRSNVHMNADLAVEPRTLFELVAPQHTFAINALVDRGVTQKVMTGWDFTMAKYREDWWLPKVLRRLPLVGAGVAPDMHEAERRVLARAVNDLAHSPKIQWITFTSPDAYAHLRGIDDGYDDLVVNVDRLIGEYRRATAAFRVEEQRIYAVLTDHGLVDVKGNVDLRKALAGLGLRVDREEATRLWNAGLDDDLAGRLDDIDVVLLVNGNSLNYLYARTPSAQHAGVGDAFSSRVPRETLVAYPIGNAQVDIVGAVAAAEGVDVVISRARDGSVFIDSKTGTGVIRTAHTPAAGGSGDGYSYEASSQDPLAYAAHPATRALMDGGFHPANAWLQASIDTEYPDAIWRLTELSTQTDCGDMVVLAKSGFDLAADYERFVFNYRGGHGGLRAAELRVPYILAGPGVAANHIVHTARAEDVGATLFHLLGLPQHKDAGGKILEPAK